MVSRVRPGRPEDVPALMTLAQVMHAEAPAHRGRPFDVAKVEALLVLLCAGRAADMVLFVVERDGVPVGGMIGGHVVEWFNAERVVFEVALFVAPGHRQGWVALKLVRALVAWAEALGAAEVRAGSTTGVDPAGTARLYQFCGFRVAGPLVVLRLAGESNVHGS